MERPVSSALLPEEIIARLVTLHDFMVNNKINYVLTGTLAINLLGIPTEVGDIDVKVDYLSDEQQNKLLELQKLSGLESREEYENSTKCYMFRVDGVKINVLLSEPTPFFNIVIDDAFGYMGGKKPVIKIQPLMYAISDKMQLGRPKDKQFMIDTINKLTFLSISKK